VAISDALPFEAGGQSRQSLTALITYGDDTPGPVMHQHTKFQQGYLTVYNSSAVRHHGLTGSNILQFMAYADECYIMPYQI